MDSLFCPSKNSRGEFARKTWRIMRPIPLARAALQHARFELALPHLPVGVGFVMREMQSVQKAINSHTAVQKRDSFPHLTRSLRAMCILSHFSFFARITSLVMRPNPHLASCYAHASLRSCYAHLVSGLGFVMREMQSVQKDA